MMTDDQYAEWQYEMYKDDQAEQYADPDEYDDDEEEMTDGSQDG